MAWINANPNPVLISAWRLSPMSSLVSWDAGSGVVGRVYLSVDGADEVVFDGPVDGKRSGSKKQAIELGRTYDFRLKRIGLLGTVIASLRLKGEEKLGTTAGLVTVVNNMLPTSQHIFDVRVTPGIESVRIRFRTRQAANCILEIKNDAGAVVGGALLGGKKAYDVVIENGFGFTNDRLQQDTNHTYRILAMALPGSLIPGDKTVTGSFRTGMRSVQFFFDRILVHEDGDPGFMLGDGDFEFYFGAGDADTMKNLGNEEVFGRESIGSGEFRNVSRVVTIPSAPPRLWAQVFAYEDDSVFMEFRPDVVTGYRSAGTTCERGSDGPESTVTEHFDFGDLAEGVVANAFEMSNGTCSISFTVSCRLRVEATAGVLLQPSIKKIGPAPRSLVPRVAILEKVDRKVVIGTPSGRARIIRLAPEGDVFIGAFSRNKEARSEGWTRLAGQVRGPLTAVASHDNRVALFALQPNGTVAHKTYSFDNDASDEWGTLGGLFVGTIAAATGRDGQIEIFGLSTDGEVLHRTVHPAENGSGADWQRIGSGVRGSLTAFTSPQGDVAVMALGREGEVLHKLLRGTDWQPDAGRFQSLGMAPPGTQTLSAELVDDNLVVIAALTENETVHLQPWRNYPDKPARENWQCVGTVNTLLESRFSIVPEDRPLPTGQDD